jgi:hypothetical protein
MYMQVGDDIKFVAVKNGATAIILSMLALGG